MNFLKNMLKGALIGVAMIIPGVSGGTIAVLLNIYDKLIEAISNLKKDFKNSFIFLLPIVLGMALAFIAMYFPLKKALEVIPIQTISLFAGLMLGSIPSLFIESKNNGFKRLDIIAPIITFIIVVGICFIPNMGNVDLSISMPTYQYILLFIMGLLASCALVVPGISGSMLLLIFGYYKPLLDTISSLKDSFGHSLLVLFIVALGIVIGFFIIAKIMNYLLKKFKRVTYYAIFGFVVGSIPAIFISYDYTGIEINSVLIITSIIVFIIGSICSYFLIKLSNKKAIKDNEDNISNKEIDNSCENNVNND